MPDVDAAGVVTDVTTADVGSSSPEVEAPETGAVATEVEEPETQEVEGAETEEAEGEPETEGKGEEGEQKDEEDLSEWTGSAAARFRELCKRAPGLEQVLAKHPNVRDAVVASFRRDAALRDRNITMAEIDAYREHCVNGISDLEAMKESLSEAEQLDNNFMLRERDGSYPGHEKFIENMINVDRQATIALLKRSPRDWQRLDPESYNQTYGQIIANTLRQGGILERVEEMYNIAKEAGDKDLTNRLANHWHYLNNFGKRREVENEDSEVGRLRRDLEQSKRQTAEQTQASNQRQQEALFGSLIEEHRQTIRGNPELKAMLSKVSKEKGSRIVEDIRGRIEKHLEKSFSFNRQFTSAIYEGRVNDAREIDRKGWQPWIVNLYVRRVLNEETPAIVQANRARNGKLRAAAARNGLANRKPQTSASESTNAPKKGLNDYTVHEILSGAAPDSIVDAYLKSKNLA